MAPSRTQPRLLGGSRAWSTAFTGCQHRAGCSEPQCASRVAAAGTLLAPRQTVFTAWPSQRSVPALRSAPAGGRGGRVSAANCSGSMRFQLGQRSVGRAGSGLPLPARGKLSSAVRCHLVRWPRCLLSPLGGGGGTAGKKRVRREREQEDILTQNAVSFQKSRTQKETNTREEKTNNNKRPWPVWLSG